MYNKRYITLHLRRMVLHLKCIGTLAIMPFATVNIIIPLLNYLEYSKYGVNEELYLNILQYSQWLIPLFSVWNIIFVLKEYIEADGNEVLYVCSDRSKFIDMLNLFAVYILNTALLFSVYTTLYKNMKYEFIRILCICIMYFGLVFFLAFLTKSITITLMVVLLYTLSSIMFSSGDAVFPLYYSLKHTSAPLFLKSYLPLGVVGMVLCSIGTVFNKKSLKYN